MPLPARLASRPGKPVGPAPAPGVSALAGTGALLLVPPEMDPAGPLLVFFHGAGGTPDASRALVQDAVRDRGVAAVLPGSVGSTWDLLTGRLGPDVAALDAALAQAFAALPAARVAFGGFSDGASYALSLGLANGDLVEAVLAFSPGFAAPPAQLGQPRVWVTHGRADTVLPLDPCGRRVVRTLRAAGYEVEYVERADGHVVPPPLVPQALSWWLGE